MKKVVTSLPFKLLLGVVIGIVVGQFSGTALMNVVVTVKFVLGEFINFCVPLIIIGFIAPSITRLGRNASRMLGPSFPRWRDEKSGRRLYASLRSRRS